MTADHIPDARKMMPAALRLADALETPTIQAGAFRHEIAAELRLLHNSNEQLAEQLSEAADEIQRLQAENELLHARCQQAYAVGRESGREDDETLLRQALNALDPPEHLRFGGTGRLKAAAITAIKERLK